MSKYNIWNDKMETEIVLVRDPTQSFSKCILVHVGKVTSCIIQQLVLLQVFYF